MASAATTQTAAAKPAAGAAAGAGAGTTATIGPSLKVVDVKARLGATKFVTDDHDFAHITVDPDVCDTCPHSACTQACPAKCFEFVDGRMKFTYEDCVECGTCDIVCTPGSVKWSHPRASFGVNYRYG